MRRVGAALLLLVSTTAWARDLPTHDVILRARDEVFARPEFHSRSQDGESVVLTVVRSVASYVIRFRDEHPIAFAVIVAMLLFTLLILVAHIVWTIVVSRRASYVDDLALPELDLRRAAPEEFRERAVRLAGEGRFEDAVRDLYTALLLTLDRRGDLGYARHKALLDYRHEVREPDARAALDDFALGYHPTSFGRRSLPEARFRDLLARLDEVRG